MISHRKFLPKMALLLGVALFSMPAVAQADPIVDFGVPAPNAGTISYAGGAAPLVGTGITVSDVVGIGTPMNAGSPPHAITGGVLSFTTGNFVNNTGAVSNFAAGGSLTIMGTVVGVPGATGTLLSGSLVSAMLVNATGINKVVVEVAVDPLNAALAAFFGVNPSPVTSTLNLQFMLGSPANPPTGFSTANGGAVLSGDVAVSATPTGVVPEPGTMLLVLTGLPLLGAGRWLRRRNAA